MIKVTIIFFLYFKVLEKYIYINKMSSGFVNSNYINTNNGVYNGSLFAIPATGFFFAQQFLTPVTLTQTHALTQVDVTNSLQLHLSREFINNELGPFNEGTGKFDVEYINIEAQAFVHDISNNYTVNPSSIISLGALSTLYSNYNNFVNSYFNYANGFNILFSYEQYNYNYGNFSNDDFINLISDLSGQITINYINEMLEYIDTYNTFGNRPGPTDISGGFLVGDLIYIPNGFQVTLTTDICNNGVLLNNLGITHAQTIQTNNSGVIYGNIFGSSGNELLVTTTIDYPPNNEILNQIVEIPILLKIYDALVPP